MGRDLDADDEETCGGLEGTREYGFGSGGVGG